MGRDEFDESVCLSSKEFSLKFWKSEKEKYLCKLIVSAKLFFMKVCHNVVHYINV